MLFSQISEAITKRGLNIRKTKEGIRIARAATIALIPVWGRSMEDLTAENLFYQALVILSGYETSEDFADWCDEYGFDASSPDMMDRFKVIGVAESNLIELIGEERYQSLLGALAIGQAIDTARPR